MIGSGRIPQAGPCSTFRRSLRRAPGGYLPAPAKPFIFCAMSSTHQAMMLFLLASPLLAGLLLRVAR
jgi:hypothetical protein